MMRRVRSFSSPLRSLLTSLPSVNEDTTCIFFLSATCGLYPEKHGGWDKELFASNAAEQYRNTALSIILKHLSALQAAHISEASLSERDSRQDNRLAHANYSCTVPNTHFVFRSKDVDLSNNIRALPTVKHVTCSVQLSSAYNHA